MSKDDRIVVYLDMTVTPGQPCPHPSASSTGLDAPLICDTCGAIGERVKIGNRYAYRWPTRNIPEDHDVDLPPDADEIADPERVSVRRICREAPLT